MQRGAGYVADDAGLGVTLCGTVFVSASLSLLLTLSALTLLSLFSLLPHQKLGYPLTVYNRTKSKTAPLVALGAKAADSIEEVGANSDVVFSIVAFPSDVRAVFLGAAGAKGLIDVMQPGSIVVDMTTSEPSLAREIAAAAAARGICALDAPVSGGDIGAREARLSIMVGGQKDAMDAITPLFQSSQSLHQRRHRFVARASWPCPAFDLTHQ